MIEQVSQLSMEHAIQLGADIIDLVEFEKPTWQTGEGNPHVESLWDVKMK